MSTVEVNCFHFRIQECQVMGAMSDSMCDLLLMDDNRVDQDNVNEVIQGSLAPSKRSGDEQYANNDDERSV